MPKKGYREKNSASRVSNNAGWHVESRPGEKPRRISHNPRLIDTHPEIAAQWHPTKNGEKTAALVTPLSTYGAWWFCEAGHEWQRQVTRRTQNNSGCPECELENSSLAKIHPELAKQWSNKNGDLSPNRVRPSSELLVWWKCDKRDHDDYKRTVHHRTNQNKSLGCPVCDGTLPEKCNSFPALFPILASEWHPKLNGDLNPFHLKPGSCAQVWWRCSKDKTHEWIAPVARRTNHNSECPYCRNWYITEENSLLAKHPEIAKEWHPTKNRFLWSHLQGSHKRITNLRLPLHKKERNRRLRASDVAFNSKEFVWWQCSVNSKHIWVASVEDRTRRQQGCPLCSALRLKTQKSLAALYPGVAKMWHQTRNLPTLPTDVVPGSAFKAYWRCPKSATHVWKTHVYSVVKSWKEGSNGCRWCSGLSADEKNSLESKCPEVAKLWHSSKNGKLLPSQVTVKSNKKVWWQCSKNHEFEATICNMVAASGRGSGGCKFCSGRATALENSLQVKYPLVAKMWHPTKNKKITSSDVTPGNSSKTFFWICDYGHTWQAKVSSMVQSFRLRSAAKGCPLCAGKKVKKKK